MPKIDSIVDKFSIGSRWNSEFLGNAGGFSGSQLWKIGTSIGGEFCLKKWPQQFIDQSRIQWIHDVLVFASANGCPEIIRPLQSSSGKTFVVHDGCFWELSKWSDGIPLDDTATQPQIESAIAVLARFHQATARYFLNFDTSSKVVEIRNQLLALGEKIDSIERHDVTHKMLQSNDWLRFKTKGHSIARDIAKFLIPFSTTKFPVQPVIRDMRPEHIFCSGNNVTGLIDFGAMRIDTIACDLARLFGGFFRDDAAKFNQAIETYSRYRNVYPFEREIVLPLNHAAVILGIANWASWIVVDNLQFDATQSVERRITFLFERFRSF